MEEKGIEHIIAKYLSGEAATEETMTLMQWLSAGEKNKTEFRKIQSYWNADVSFMHAPEIVPDFEKLKERIRKSESQKSVMGLWLRPAIVAAVAIVAILVGSQLVLKMNSTEAFTYITGSSIADFVLPDGTEVTLNKNRKLSYSASFGRSGRTVSLDGEAYFDVVHDKKQQFVVNAGSAKITVLGTVFSVKCREAEDILKTSLVEGNVKFETANQSISLILTNKSCIIPVTMK
ncbi:FecR family protein [Porphyromonadaceae bacterium NLAE-zl-C104]|nr:FecR family protein [Porphyromonadaceae bacterium NLAE-zl-C104]